MAIYWCRFLDRDGRAYAGEKIICADLEAAIEKARGILADGEGYGFEIWERATRVHIEQPSSERAR
ncbi:MAG TPA: hypothetical protein VJR47_19880 [Stellaceae bacterium]|nr:hypothetical protein [Stellaceae bacterium]